MDAIIILFIIIIMVFFVKKTFSGFVYSVGMLDIFLRLINFLNIRLLKGEMHSFISKYFSSSIPNLIEKYTNGVLSDILIWIYIVIMIIFEFYIIKIFLRKK